MAEDIQQQIADGARPRLARVGDRIEPQPACFKCSRSSGRVVEVAAAKPPRFMHAYGSCESDGEVTERVANTFGLEWPRPESQSAAEVLDMPAERTLIGPPHAHQDRPCTDACYEPEPQPAEPGMVADGCSWCQAHGYTPGQQLTHEGVPIEPADPGPLVLTLPVVPDGAVALVGRLLDSEGGSVRYVRSGDFYHPDNSSEALLLGEVLDREGSQGVTVEMAPPREPRVWPKLDPAPDDISSKVEVWTDGGARILLLLQREVHGRWSQNPGTPFADAYSWGEVLELGEVREVLT